MATLGDTPGTTEFPTGGGVAIPTYTVSNVTTDRAYNANSYTTDELADVLGTFIADVAASGGSSGLYYNVTDAAYGATGDGVTDDRAAIQAAVDACIAVGGGIVYFPAGTYRIVCTSGGTGGQGYGMVIDDDNVALVGDGASSILKPETSGGTPRCVLVSGGAKIDRTQWYDYAYQEMLGYTINTAARSASSVTCSVAGSAAHGGFVAGDYVYIRTGQTIHDTGNNRVQPVAELNVVQSVSGEVISLRYPLGHPFAQEYFMANFFTAVTSGTHSAGATVITVASTTGWATRDVIRIPGAGLNGNDFFSAVSSLTGTTLTMENALPTGASVANGTTIYNGRTSGGGNLTSTTANNHLSPLLIAKVTDRTVSNFQMRDLAFAQSTVNFMGMLSGVDIFNIQRIYGYFYKNGIASGVNFRNGVIRDCVQHATGAGLNFAGVAPFGPSTGCSDVIYTDNFISCEGQIAIGMVEGCADIWITRNTLMSAPNSSTNHVLTVRTRGWGHRLTENKIINGSGQGIFVDPAVIGGVVIDKNDVRGTMAGGILTQAVNVTMPWNEVQSGLSYRTSAGVGLARPGPILSLSDWVTWVTAEQTVTLGEIPSDWYVHGVDIHVSVAFNSDGTDQIEVGYSGADTAYATLTDVSTTGVKTVTLGTGIGRQTALRSVVAKYLNGGSEPTAGKAVVIVRFSLIPLTP